MSDTDLNDLPVERLMIEASMGRCTVLKYIALLQAQGLIRCARTGPGRGKCYTFEVLRDGMKIDWAPLKRVG